MGKRARAGDWVLQLKHKKIRGSRVGAERWMKDEMNEYTIAHRRRTEEGRRPSYLRRDTFRLKQGSDEGQWISMKAADSGLATYQKV